MRGCHSCPHKAAVDAGKFRNTPWEKTPCASCQIALGGYAIEYDEDRLEETLDASQFRGASLPEESVPSQDLPIEVMREFVNGLLTLPSELRDVVAMRYRGMKYEEIAQVQKVTMACVEKRHRRAFSLFPALREMFPEKVAKQKRRKPHRPSGSKQRKRGENAPKREVSRTKNPESVPETPARKSEARGSL